MTLPFTLQDFLDVFSAYNLAVFPAQWVLAAAGVLTAWLAARGGHANARPVLSLLAALWLWMGGVYHLAFFRAINPAATLFGTACLAQGLFFLWLGWRPHDAPHLAIARSPRGVAGALLVAYSLAVYPALGPLLGHHYPAAPTFGLPCPTTIFTLGVLLWAEPPLPWWAVAVPLLWSAVGTSAALQLGMREDLALPVAGLAFLVLHVRGRRSAPAHARHV